MNVYLKMMQVNLKWINYPPSSHALLNEYPPHYPAANSPYGPKVNAADNFFSELLLFS